LRERGIKGGEGDNNTNYENIKGEGYLSKARETVLWKLTISGTMTPARQSAPIEIAGARKTPRNISWTCCCG
jgi:hypothetical protein